MILWTAFILHEVLINNLLFFKDNLYEIIAFCTFTIGYSLLWFYILGNKYTKLVLASSILFSIWVMSWPIFGYNRFNHLMTYIVIQAIVAALVNYLYLRIKKKNNVSFLNHCLHSFLLSIGHAIMFTSIMYLM